MKIGCGTVTFREHSLEQAMDWIAQAGYEYVEPQATAPWCPHVDPWHDDPDAFRQLVRDFGFEGASALWSPHGAIIPDPESIAGITQALRWSAAAGIPVVNSGDGRKPDAMTDVHVKDIVGTECVALGRGTVDVKGCIDLLTRHGYDGVLSLETEGGFTPEEGRRMIEESRVFLSDVLRRG